MSIHKLYMKLLLIKHVYPKKKTTTTQQTRKYLFKKRNQLLFDVHNILSKTKIYNLLIFIPILPILSYLKKIKIN
jgi:hypothetical protein